jgi:hypothetical protein
MPKESKKPRGNPQVPPGEKSAVDESGYPKRNTEQDRERKPGTRTREEIRKGTVPGKTH